MTLRCEVVLREPVPDVDGPVVGKWFGDDQKGVWNAFLMTVTGNQEGRLNALIGSSKHRAWIAEVDRRPVGLVWLSTEGAKSEAPKIFIYVARKERRRGYADVAVCMVTRHAFEDDRVKCVIAQIELGNTRSADLFRRLGFEETGDRTLAESTKGARELLEWRLRRPEVGSPGG